MESPVEQLPSKRPTSRWDTFRSGRIGTWAILLGKFASVQMLVQALGFASGILLVRSLSKQDYALFTIANALMGTMSVLADSGIGSGLTAIGGRVWNDGFRFGQLIQTALKLRRILGGVVILIGIPLIAALLLKNGATSFQTFVITVLIVISICFQLSNGVLSVIPRLLLQTSRLQLVDFYGALTRLILLGLAWAALLLNVSVALATATIAFAVQWWLLRRWTRQSITQNAPADPEMRTEIMAIVRRQAPNGIFFCLNGQLSIWLISIFGNSSSVADLGALGRLSVVFTIIASVMNAIVIPRFVRCQDPNILLRRYFQILGTHFGIAGILVLVAWTLPEPLLWVLGGKYLQLHRELVLVILSAGLSSIVGASWSLNSARGWFLPPWMNLGVSLIAQVIAIQFINFSTVTGVLVFSICPTIPELAIYTAYSLRKMRQMRRKETLVG